MLESWLSGIVYWHWWILGVLLAVAEIVVPGVFLLWLGIAAVLTGFLALVFPALTWQGESLFFAVLSIASAYAGRRVYTRWEADDTDDPALNQRAQRYVGQIFTLSQPIVNGAGRLTVGDGVWKVSSPVDLPAGTHVRVVGAESTILRVEAV